MVKKTYFENIQILENFVDYAERQRDSSQRRADFWQTACECSMDDLIDARRVADRRLDALGDMCRKPVFLYMRQLMCTSGGDVVRRCRDGAQI